MKDAAADAVNRTLARTVEQLFERTGDYSDIDRALGSDPNPNDLYWYFWGVAQGWLLAAPISGVLSVPIAYVATTIFGDRGNKLVVQGLVFCVAFCITGAADATWRYYVASAARRRVKKLGAVDDETRRLMRTARLPDASLLLQLLVGLWVGSRA